MTWAKVCGITNLDDALAAAEAGADALGFVFAESTRRVAPEQVKLIIAQLPARLETIGVFVNTPAEEVQRVVDFCGLTAVQLHGKETPYFCAAMPVPVIKAFRVRDADGLAAIPNYRVVARAILLDAFVPGQAGGTGRQLDTGLAIKAKQLVRDIIVAGGISAANVGEVIAAVRPFGVDASSKLESAPGKKDTRLVREYIESVRRADAT